MLVLQCSSTTPTTPSPAAPINHAAVPNPIACGRFTNNFALNRAAAATAAAAEKFAAAAAAPAPAPAHVLPMH